MPKFTLLLSGPLTPTGRLRRQLEGSRVIAADGGMEHARSLGLKPELWIGDFDSSSTELQALHPEVPKQRFPQDKDHTDGELAARAAQERGATDLLMLGALGGQTDHALANLLLGVRLAQNGARVVLSSGAEEAHPLVPGTLQPDLPPGVRFSVLALSDLEGLTLRGARWPLHRARVPFGSTWTVSNETAGGLEVELTSGYGVLIAYPAS